MTALQYLRSIEWRQIPTGGWCQACNRLQEHTLTCPLAAAIADAEKLEQYRAQMLAKEKEEKS